MAFLKKPCTVDMSSAQDVIAHFRDLIDIGPMLVMDVEAEILKFRKKLTEAGWDKDHIQRFQEYAASSTHWEGMIPRRLKEFGDRRAYQDWKERSK